MTRQLDPHLFSGGNIEEAQRATRDPKDHEEPENPVGKRQSVDRAMTQYDEFPPNCDMVRCGYMTDFHAIGYEPNAAAASAGNSLTAVRDMFYAVKSTGALCGRRSAPGISFYR
jgi:hypothetical protein